MISDGKARRIASEWHDGGRDTYAFVSTGSILESTYSRFYLSADSDRHSPDMVELVDLLAYLSDKGERGPQAGWSELWDEDER